MNPAKHELWLKLNRINRMLAYIGVADIKLVKLVQNHNKYTLMKVKVVYLDGRNRLINITLHANQNSTLLSGVSGKILFRDPETDKTVVTLQFSITYEILTVQYFLINMPKPINFILSDKKGLIASNNLYPIKITDI